MKDFTKLGYDSGQLRTHAPQPSKLTERENPVDIDYKYGNRKKSFYDSSNLVSSVNKIVSQNEADNSNSTAGHDNDNVKAGRKRSKDRIQSSIAKVTEARSYDLDDIDSVETATKRSKEKIQSSMARVRETRAYDMDDLENLKPPKTERKRSKERIQSSTSKVTETKNRDDTGMLEIDIHNQSKRTITRNVLRDVSDYESSEEDLPVKPKRNISQDNLITVEKSSTPVKYGMFQVKNRNHFETFDLSPSKDEKPIQIKKSNRKKSTTIVDDNSPSKLTKMFETKNSARKSSKIMFDETSVNFNNSSAPEQEATVKFLAAEMPDELTRNISKMSIRNNVLDTSSKSSEIERALHMNRINDNDDSESTTDTKAHKPLPLPRKKVLQPIGGKKKLGKIEKIMHIEDDS